MYKLDDIHLFFIVGGIIFEPPPLTLHFDRHGIHCELVDVSPLYWTLSVGDFHLEVLVQSPRKLEVYYDHLNITITLVEKGTEAVTKLLDSIQLDPQSLSLLLGSLKYSALVAFLKNHGVEIKSQHCDLEDFCHKVTLTPPLSLIRYAR